MQFWSSSNSSESELQMPSRNNLLFGPKIIPPFYSNNSYYRWWAYSTHIRNAFWIFSDTCSSGSNIWEWTNIWTNSTTHFGYAKMEKESSILEIISKYKLKQNLNSNRLRSTLSPGFSTRQLNEMVIAISKSIGNALQSYFVVT